ncbi:unnamed protein product [Adineta steineri]|uniref:Uncharacterized protein n=1 Tax=Adineta steineri TaxID=433720 RepID=A0A818FXT5_9BILA|nr:unnamed protein product [Adineta steineri]CAF3480571.1 unnamed protein product [Adineta steineri]
MAGSLKSVDEQRRSLSLANRNDSLSIESDIIPSRRKSVTKVSDNHLEHLILGDFELIHIVDCEEYVLCCKYSPTDDVFAVGLGNGTIKIYSKAGVLQYVLTDSDANARRYPVTCLKFYSNQTDLNVDNYKLLAATYTAGYVKVWHYSTQQCIFTFNEKERQPLALDFNCSYTRLYVAGSDCVINCYDFMTKTFIRKFQASESRELMDGHKNRIHAIRSHPIMESVFLTGGWDETIHYWDERAPHSQKHFSGPNICGDALDIVDERQTILTGSWRKNSTLQIWDFSSGKLIKDPFRSKATSMLYCTKFTSKDYILCAGNAKNEALIYDYSLLQIIGGITNLENAVYCADTGVTGRNMIVGSAKNIFIVNDNSLLR